MLATLAQAVVNGLLIGGIYALVSIGVTLIFGVVKIVNFAQGEFVMIGMYISFFLASSFGIDPHQRTICRGNKNVPIRHAWRKCISPCLANCRRPNSTYY